MRRRLLGALLNSSWSGSSAGAPSAIRADSPSGELASHPSGCSRSPRGASSDPSRSARRNADFTKLPSHTTGTVGCVPDRLLDDLDPHQRAAVTEPHVPLAILAPAGSGK